MSKISLKTEHGGAKRGQGYWGSRKVAKQVSKKARRVREHEECRDVACDEIEMQKTSDVRPLVANNMD